MQSVGGTEHLAEEAGLVVDVGLDVVGSALAAAGILLGDVARPERPDLTEVVRCAARRSVGSAGSPATGSGSLHSSMKSSSVGPEWSFTSKWFNRAKTASSCCMRMRPEGAPNREGSTIPSLRDQIE